MKKEVFIARPVHDQLLEHFPDLIQEIFMTADGHIQRFDESENPEPGWQLAGVSVTISPSLYDSYVHALSRLVSKLSTLRNV